MAGTRALELAIAWRYLRSRRGSRLLSFISVIAVAGVAVGVSALIIIIGVMNGLQTDLREKILVGSPDVRVLTYGESLRMDGWRRAAAQVESLPGVVSVAPFVVHQGLRLLEMEWIDGFDLREILKPETIALTHERHPPERVEYIERVILGPGTKQPRLQPGVAISILRDCLAGLATLNQAGLVHGDIKPGNIMVTRMGRSKLIDIGSAVDLRQ